MGQVDASGDDKSSDDEIDNEEVGGEWVTEDNLYKHMSNGLAVDARKGKTNEQEDGEE